VIVFKQTGRFGAEGIVIGSYHDVLRRSPDRAGSSSIDSCSGPPNATFTRRATKSPPSPLDAWGQSFPLGSEDLSIHLPKYEAQHAFQVGAPESGLGREDR
jgi:hypothetical protein